MEDQKKVIPYSNWPWWVKIITMPMSKPINPSNHILIVIGLLLITSLSLLFNLKFITEMSKYGRNIMILFANLSIIALWQALAIIWIRKNSSWDLIKAGTIQKIIVGLLIFLFFGYPIILLILQ